MDGMTNLVTLQGRLGSNPRSNVSENGRQVFFPIASTNARGETTWIDVAVFGRFEEAMAVAETLKKGDLVTIYGQLNARMDRELIADPTGGEASMQNRRRHSIIADVVEKEQDARAQDDEFPSSKELLLARFATAA